MTRIVIIEDEVIIAMDLKRILQKLGYDAEYIVDNGEAGIKIVEEVSPDIVLCDIVIKGDIDGIDVAQTIRERFDIPVIFVTAYSNKEVLDRAKVTKPYGYIIKPFRERELYITIEIALYIHKIQQELKESEKKYKHLFDTMAQGVVYQNSVGEIVSANPAAQNILGLSQMQITDRTSKDPIWKAIHEDGSPFPEETHPAMVALKTGQTVNNVVMGVYNPEKDLHRWILINANPLFKKGETEPFQVYTTFTDITERKEAESTIKQLNENLEKKVQERTLELESAYKELESFSYSMSHDFRAPLRSINNFSQIIKENYYKEFDEESKNYFDRINKASLHLEKLVNGLIKIAYINSVKLKHEQIDLSSMINEVIRNMKEGSEYRADIIIQEELFTWGDKRLLTIMLENLLSNACKFTQFIEKPVIEVGKTGKSKDNVFFIKDNGIGFDMAFSNKLFGHFQRLHGKEFPGIGIGLSMVYRIIRRHNGNIWAQSKPGEGTTFFFTL